MKFVTRAEWGARAPLRRTGLSASFGTTIHYEGPALGSFPHSSCPSKVRGIQAFHMDARHWSDIAYTAVVCPHEFVFDGRGIGVRTGANGTNVGNATAYAVCYLVGKGDPVSAGAIAAGAEYLAYLRGPGRAGSGVNCHRDWKPTECPGVPLCTAVRAGSFSGGSPPPPVPPPDDEEAELMAAKDEIIEALTKVSEKDRNAVIAILGRLIDVDDDAAEATLDRMVRSLLLGNYGEGNETHVNGDLTWLDSHVRAVVTDSLAPVVARLDRLLDFYEAEGAEPVVPPDADGDVPEVPADG